MPFPNRNLKQIKLAKMALKAASGVDIATRLAQYVPLDGDKAAIRAQAEKLTSHLTENDRKALALVARAAEIMDDIYLEQEWAGAIPMKKQLLANQSTEDEQLLWRFFDINMGPWDRLDENKVFVEGAPARVPGGNYYPADMSKEEFESWVASLGMCVCVGART